MVLKLNGCAIQSSSMKGLNQAVICDYSALGTKKTDTVMRKMLCFLNLARNNKTWHCKENSLYQESCMQ